MTATLTATPFVYSGTELDALAGANNYYRSILHYFKPFLGERIVEVGAGIGTFAAHLMEARKPTALTLIEPAENNIDTLRERFAGEARVRVLHGYLDAMTKGLTAHSLVAVNVLEHVRDDVGFLRAARRVIAPGGHLLLFVPACQWLYGAMDAAFEHHRRYSKALLADRLRAAGFDKFRLRYFNLPGILPWFIAGRILNRTTVRERDARRYDRWIMRWVGPIERRCEPPVGQSILTIAQVG